MSDVCFYCENCAFSNCWNMKDKNTEFDSDGNIIKCSQFVKDIQQTGNFTLKECKDDN